MTSKKTRRALLSSVLSLVLCCSMLIGTTFAWFTDEVTSTGNIIKSGTLDVEMSWSDTKDGQYKDASTGAIFDYKFWEPGYVDIKYIKLENVGDLAFKYQLTVNPTVGNADGNKLAEVIDVYAAIVKDGFNEPTRDTVEGMTKLGTLDTLIGDNLADDGILLPVEGNTQHIDPATIAGEYYTGEVTVCLALKMQEEAGNEYQDLSIGNGFSVKLLATQYTYENDSFDNTYDEEAFYVDAVATTEAELVEALANAKEGAIIGIEGDGVTWTTGAGIGSTPFLDAAATGVKNITLLGLDEEATFTAVGSGVGGIGIDGGTVTFKNLKIADDSVSYAENNWEYGYLEFRGNTVFENCEVVNAIMMEGDNATFRNCKFNSNKDNEYAVWVSNGDATFVDCTFTGARGLKTHEAYGSEVGAIVVDGCTFYNLTKKPGVAIGTMNADTAITIQNSEFINCQGGDQGLYIYETDTDVNTFDFVCEKNKILGDVVAAGSAAELLTQVQGGTLAGDVVIVDDIEVEPASELLLAASGAEVSFNGNGNTITTNGTGAAAGEYGYVSFIPANNGDADISNVKVEGSGFVSVGIHPNDGNSVGGGSTGGTYTVNELVIEDLVATLAINNGGNDIAAAFTHYGKATMTDCVMTGTTSSKDGYTPYDAAFVNGTTTTIDGGKYGAIYLAHQAKVTIQGAEIDTIDSYAIKTSNLGQLVIRAGAKVDTINLIKNTNYAVAEVVIEDGATVGTINYDGQSYTQAQWQAR